MSIHASDIDLPEVIAQVTAAFHAYEDALMGDDIAAMDALFHAAPSTVRYGVGEVLYGIEAIRAFRIGAAVRRSAGSRMCKCTASATISLPRMRNSFATAAARAAARARAGCALPMAGKWWPRMSRCKARTHERGRCQRAGQCRLRGTLPRTVRALAVGGGTRCTAAPVRRCTSRADAGGAGSLAGRSDRLDPRASRAGRQGCDRSAHSLQHRPPNRRRPAWIGSAKTSSSASMRSIRRIAIVSDFHS